MNSRKEGWISWNDSEDNRHFVKPSAVSHITEKAGTGHSCVRIDGENHIIPFDVKDTKKAIEMALEKELSSDVVSIKSGMSRISVDRPARPGETLKISDGEFIGEPIKYEDGVLCVDNFFNETGNTILKSNSLPANEGRSYLTKPQ